MRCPKCGANLEDHSTICLLCETPIQTKSEYSPQKKSSITTSKRKKVKLFVLLSFFINLVLAAIKIYNFIYGDGSLHSSEQYLINGFFEAISKQDDQAIIDSFYPTLHNDSLNISIEETVDTLKDSLGISDKDGTFSDITFAITKRLTDIDINKINYQHHNIDAYIPVTDAFEIEGTLKSRESSTEKISNFKAVICKCNRRFYIYSISLNGKDAILVPSYNNSNID